jgi:hypothetical protein
MICYTPPQMTSVPIMQAVNRIRQVEAHGAGVQAARALGICFGDNSDQNPFHVPVDNASPAAEMEWNGESALNLAESAAQLALAE